MPLTYSVDIGVFNHVRDDLALWWRRAVFDLFMRACGPRPDARVADFGVSGHRSHPVHYFFESLYPYRWNLTAIGRASEEAGWLPEEFPGLQYLETDLMAIPVPDLYFDCGICNAVVEHAGPRQKQQVLVREVCRVCRCVMFTTPNKRFPLELHTFLPLLHWLPDDAYRSILRRIGFGYYADIDNLNLVDAWAFLELFPVSRHNRLLRLGLPVLSTNLVCVSSVGDS